MRAPRIAAFFACAAACGEVLPENAPDGSDAGDPDAAADGANASDAEASACLTPTCPSGLSCKEWTFGPGVDTATCDGWEFNGQVDGTTTHECTNGKLHIAAAGTLDITATAKVDNPDIPHRLRVAARIGIVTWDQGRLLRVKSGTATVAQLVVGDVGAGKRVIGLCDDAAEPRCSPPFTLTPNSEHLFVLETDQKSTTLTIDCVEIGSIAPVPLQFESDARTEVEFGKPNADPSFDGTIDDVTVTFNLP